MPFTTLLTGAIACSTVVCSGVQSYAEDATPPSSITAPAGFRVELLRSAAPDDGSWISLTLEPDGRIIVGRDDAGFARLSPPDGGVGTWTCQRLDDQLKHCRGVLYAHDSLYVNATDSREFWRFRDLDRNGTYEDSKLLKSFDYRSRFGHGQNQVVLGPDGLLYLIIGNDVSFPEGVSAESPYLDPLHDRLLLDPHDAGEDDRVGYVLRTDPEGSEWVIVAGGFRNQFDAVFNADGELFTWDSDMEWEVGLPWYRPTRLNHVVSGGEYGWRWGSSKWPPDYPDSLPSNLETGLGSPTGMAFGYGSRFPPQRRDQLFMADWQHGKILAVTLTPEGASYRAEAEVFVEGAPLNVCDLLFGPDGALYFITGGRGSQSGLYRVTYDGPDEPAPALTPDDARAQRDAEEARALRRQLEMFHVKHSPGALDAIWPRLAHPDRWVRNAARIAVEHQPAASWTPRIAAETDPLRRATALLAWARVAAPDVRGDVHAALLAAPLPGEPETLAVHLRAWSILLARGPAPSPGIAQQLMSRLAPLYPHDALTVNRDLCELLVSLQWPEIVSQTLPLIESAASQEEQIHYVHTLLRYSGEWTPDQRRTLLKWFPHASRLSGGHRYAEVLGNMQQDFLDSFTQTEQTLLSAEIAALSSTASEQPALPQRPLVQRWTLADLQPLLSAELAPHDTAAGRRLLGEAGCLKCHRWEQTGAAVGPDLTSVGKRYSAQLIAESIIEPSKVIDPKYAATQYLLTDGRVVIGRAAQVSAQEITVETDALTQERVKVRRDEIEESRPATVSPMPAGLLDGFTADEIRALLAYLRGGAHANP